MMISGGYNFMEQSVNYVKVSPAAVEPVRSSTQAAGWDLSACIDAHAVIAAGQTTKIGTGIAVELPEGTFGAVFARSGIAAKRGLRPSNCVGVIDSDYRGEIMVAMHNDSNQVQVIHPGERIAQLVVIPYLPVVFNKVDNLSSTARGDGGFGSTGT